VDDFSVKYTQVKDAVHLMTALEAHYKVSKDWDATRYCGLTIKWDYTNCTVDLSIPGYIKCTLLRFSHSKPMHIKHSLHAWQKPKYGTKVQFADLPSISPCLDAMDTKCIQEIVGVLLYYVHAIDNTLLTALDTIATQQAKSSQATMEVITQLLNYCATYPNATICYHASDMVLWIHGNALYHTAPKGWSHTAGYHFLSSCPSMAPTAHDTPPHPTIDPLTFYAK